MLIRYVGRHDYGWMDVKDLCCSLVHIIRTLVLITLLIPISLVPAPRLRTAL